MRIALVSLFIALFLGCATSQNGEKDQQDQALSHPVCVMTEEQMTRVQAELPTTKHRTVFCGPLAAPHQHLGLGLVEGVLPLADGSSEHVLMMFKFSKEESGWALGGAEVVFDFVL